MLKLSTGLRDYMAVTGSLRAALGSCVMKIYAGTEPATADATIGSATLLCTITTGGDGSTALAWEAAASSGVLLKDITDVWEGTNAASGTAAFFRFQTLADANGSSTSAVRIQGLCAIAGAELNLSSLTLTASAVQTIDNFALTVPAQ